MNYAAESGTVDWDKRMEAISRIAFYVLLGASALLALISGASGSDVLIVLGLAALATGWHTWWVVLHHRWAERRVLMAVYFVGLYAVAAALVARSPWFAFFAFSGVVAALQFLHGFWRYAGVIISAGLVAVCQTGGFHRPTPGLAVLIAVLALFQSALYLMFGVVGDKTDEQNKKRKKIIDELAETNRQLEQALQEKAGLQAQLLTQAREAGVSAERQRMAREIHDTLAQGLAGIITQLQAVQQVPGQQADWQRHLDTATQLARDSLAEARRSVSAIRPRLLEDAKLPEALSAVAGNWSALHEVRTEVTTTGQARSLHPEIEVTLLRTAQEALANVGKHAQASRVALTLSYMEDVVTLDVRDDGQGFVPAGVTQNGHGGFGLTGMRQRLGNVAGTLEIESEPGGGTAISASVPAVGGQPADA
ncbi:MAG TPA: sensor histidine kinase [Streptosporangiaceae bacterium]